MVLEARDILDYALVLLEPPSPEEEALALMGGAGDAAGPHSSAASISSSSHSMSTADASSHASHNTVCSLVYKKYSVVLWFVVGNIIEFPLQSPVLLFGTQLAGHNMTQVLCAKI